MYIVIEIKIDFNKQNSITLIYNKRIHYILMLPCSTKSSEDYVFKVLFIQ